MSDQNEHTGDLSDTPFRVYMLDGEEPVCIAQADDVSLAEALLDLERQGRSTVVAGIMYRPVVGEPGVWLVNPFASRA